MNLGCGADEQKDITNLIRRGRSLLFFGVGFLVQVATSDNVSYVLLATINLVFHSAAGVMRSSPFCETFHNDY